MSTTTSDMVHSTNLNAKDELQLNIEPLDMDKDVSRLELLDNLQPPRDHYVNTAIKFLQNPRVRTTSLVQKEKFLKQKGLSGEEIQLAFQKSGAYADEKNNKNRLALETSSTSRDLAYYNYQSSLWFKIKEIANVVALVSFGAYGLHQLWVRVLGPKFFGLKTQKKKSENVQSQLFESINQLNENISELKQLIVRLTNSTENGSNGSSHRMISGSNSNYEFQEFKQELSAIKGLLLNRHQFPSSPGIPSWQMLETEEDVGLDAETETPPSMSTAGGIGRRKRDRKAGSNPGRKSETCDDEHLDSESKPSSSVERKTSSNDSNNGLYSGSSCEVVFMGGKNDSSDHSDD